eukprot:gene5752-7342_t
MDAASLILQGLVIEDVAREETASERRWREYKESEAILGGVVEDDPEPDENEEYLFYTAEEFEELIKCITAQEKLVPEYANLVYSRLLTPVPMWCQMARSALPVNTEEIWMSEDKKEIDAVTNRLVAKQKQLSVLYRDEMVKTFTNLPDELARLIAEFSGPVALDVRVAFNDDEEQSDELIKTVQAYVQIMMEEKETIQQQLQAEHQGRGAEGPAMTPSATLRRCSKCKKVQSKPRPVHGGNKNGLRLDRGPAAESVPPHRRQSWPRATRVSSSRDLSSGSARGGPYCADLGDAVAFIVAEEDTFTKVSDPNAREAAKQQ